MAKQTKQTPALSLAEIQDALFTGQVNLEHAAEVIVTSKAALDRAIKALHAMPELKLGRYSRNNPAKGCPVLQGIGERFDAHYRALAVTRVMLREGWKKATATAFVDKNAESEFIQQTANRLSAIRKSVKLGYWHLDAKTEDGSTSLRMNSEGKFTPKDKAAKPASEPKTQSQSETSESNTVLDSGKTTADKLRSMIQTIVSMVQNDETPEGYNPTELVRDLKAALSQIH
jgi:hypothetical protein